MSNVNIIVASDPSGVIGCGGCIPWHCSADLIRFRRLSMGGAVVVGRRTHESIGRPLPGRLTVVLTRDPEYSAYGCIVACSLADGISVAMSLRSVVWICGGGSIYREALGIADAVYLTTMHTSVRGDVTFPLRSAWPGEWECGERVTAQDHTFEVWHRLWPFLVDQAQPQQPVTSVTDQSHRHNHGKPSRYRSGSLGRHPITARQHLCR